MRLKTNQIKTVRLELLAEQENRCAVCNEVIDNRPVLDHDHKTGQIRSVLHAGCNSLLGVVENNYLRFGIANLEATLSGIYEYIQHHKAITPDMLHPTHRTSEEKKELFRKRRKIKKSKKLANSSCVPTESDKNEE